MPQAKHGGRGVCSVAVYGSKLEGTGFDKEHIGHIHVADVTGAVSVNGELVWLREKSEVLSGPLEGVPLREGAFDGFGTNVIFGDDFKNPACLLFSLDNMTRF